MPKIVELKKARNVKNLSLFNALCSELGGITRISDICECTPPSVSGWKHYGIPKARLMYLQLAYPNLKAWKHLKV